jgi:hypothetical protein
LNLESANLEQATPMQANLDPAVAKPVRSLKLDDVRKSTNPKVVLKEIFELIQEYGPIWYTEDLHIRARIALSDFQ